MDIGTNSVYVPKKTFTGSFSKNNRGFRARLLKKFYRCQFILNCTEVYCGPGQLLLIFSAKLIENISKLVLVGVTLRRFISDRYSFVDVGLNEMNYKVRTK
jgi:hypothetical protein